MVSADCCSRVVSHMRTTAVDNFHPLSRQRDEGGLRDGGAIWERGRTLGVSLSDDHWRGFEHHLYRKKIGL